MLVMQFKIIPLTADIGAVGSFSVSSLGNVAETSISDASKGYNAQSLARPFLYLLIVQGLLAGVTIGKLSEGSIKSGVKHSFIMTITAFLISTGANLFLG